MADSDRPDAPAEDDPEEPAGVFGNLPRTRPGARSPRRDQAGASPRASRPRRSEAKRAAEAQAPPPPPPAGDEPGPEPGAGRPETRTQSGGGIEDVAWAGVAAAAEAATIGVRLATRALESMRDAVDRR